MGRKVHPIGMRLGINQPWHGRWFAEGSTYRQQLHQDFAIRNLLIGKTSKGGAAANTRVRQLRKDMPDAIKDGKAGVSRVDVERTPGKIRIAIHTAKPGILIGRKGEGVKKIRQALEALVGKKVELDIKQGAEGIKIMVGGRLGGAEMSRDVWLREGRVPLQTLRANLDFAMTEASTTYGQLGVKVWIYKGEVAP